MTEDMFGERLREERRRRLKDAGLPRLLPFFKMEGLGNDYVYVEDFESAVADPPALAVVVSHRRFGVGGDGLVLIRASERADFGMRIFNADGSEAEMCGNASRCVGKYLFEQGRTDKKELALETLAGIRMLRLEVSGGRVERVRVNMGKPSFAPADLPMRFDGAEFIGGEIAAGDRLFRATAVSMGNPHLVIPVAHLESFDVRRYGPILETHPLFPRRINVEFVEPVGKNRIRARVWERGSGETMACGTGACAVLAACSRIGLAGRGAAIELPGGRLDVEMDRDGAIGMTGPARFVFRGEYQVW